MTHIAKSIALISGLYGDETDYWIKSAEKSLAPFVRQIGRVCGNSVFSLYTATSNEAGKQCNICWWTLLFIFTLSSMNTKGETEPSEATAAQNCATG